MAFLSSHFEDALGFDSVTRKYLGVLLGPYSLLIPVLETKQNSLQEKKKNTLLLLGGKILKLFYQKCRISHHCVNIFSSLLSQAVDIRLANSETDV